MFHIRSGTPSLYHFVSSESKRFSNKSATIFVLGGTMFHRLGELWCRLFHDCITRPQHQQYTCLKCLRVYSVDFD